MTHARMLLTRRVHTGAALIALVTVTSGTLATGANAAAAAPAESPVRTSVVRTVNHVRALHGCKALTVRKQLTRSAQGHADDMARTGLFSHTSADGRSWIVRIRNAGWSQPGGENIAAGFSWV